MKRAIYLVVLYFLYQFLFAFLVMVGAVAIDIAKNGGEAALSSTNIASYSSDTNWLSIAMILAGVAMLVHLFKGHYISIPEQVTAFLNKEKSGLVLLLCIPFIYVVMYLLNVVSEAIDLPNLLEDTFLDMSGNVWGILSITLVAPVLEECLFRGAIEGHLLKKMKPWAAILISALLFGIVHMNPAQVVYASLIGIVLGWLYWRSGSVLPSIVAHVLNNTIAVIGMRYYDSEGIESFEELADEQAQPIIWAAYAGLAILLFLVLRKIFNSQCNLSEPSNV